MTSQNHWARTPGKASIEGLKSRGPRRNYWVIGKDGKRRGPAPLDNDGVRKMKELGCEVIPLKQGEFYTTELRG